MSWIANAFKSLNPVSGSHRQRGATRYQTSGFTCPLGEILDLSATGMRVFINNKGTFAKGQVLSICVQSPFQKLAVRAVVCWVRQVRWGVVHMGLRFVDLAPGVASILENMARYGFVDMPQKNAENRSAAGKTVVGSTGECFTPVNPQHAKPAEQTNVPLQASAEFEDLYALFGLNRSASHDDIQRAYRILARRYHPDTCTEPDASKLFDLITKAYEVLSDPESREAYDAAQRDK